MLQSRLCTLFQNTPALRTDPRQQRRVEMELNTNDTPPPSPLKASLRSDSSVFCHAVWATVKHSSGTQRIRSDSRKHFILLLEGSVVEMELSLKRTSERKKSSPLIYKKQVKSICFFEINRDTVNCLQASVGFFHLSFVY